MSPLLIDARVYLIPHGHSTTLHYGLVNPQLLADLLHIAHTQHRIPGSDYTAVAQLPTRFSVHGRDVHDNLNGLTFVGFGPQFTIHHKPQNLGITLQLVKAGECGGVFVNKLTVDGQIHMTVLLSFVVRLGPGALLSHQRVKAFLVHIKPSLSSHFQGEVNGETIGVVQRERLRASQRGGTAGFD